MLNENKDQRNQALQKSFGKRVRYLRLKSGLSQEKLAFKCEIHRNYLGSVERGERNIALRNIYAIACALGVTLPELLDFEIDVPTVAIVDETLEKDVSKISL
jgi:transcriptional regulator with XRE-family HTH domain